MDYFAVGIGGNAILQLANIFAWGTPFAVSLFTSQRSVIWPTTAVTMLFVAYGHASLDLARTSTSGLAILFIPAYALFLGVCTSVLAALATAAIDWVNRPRSRRGADSHRAT